MPLLPAQSTPFPLAILGPILLEPVTQRCGPYIGRFLDPLTLFLLPSWVLFIVVILRDPVFGLGLKRGIVRAFVLQAERGIEECFVSGVAIGYDAENAAGIVVVWQHLIHGFVHEVGHEVEAELQNLLPVPSSTGGALLVGHGERFEAFWEGHGRFTLGETGASDEGRAGLRSFYLHWIRAAVRALAELGQALRQTYRRVYFLILLVLMLPG